jgi:hypothetical protein
MSTATPPQDHEHTPAPTPAQAGSLSNWHILLMAAIAGLAVFVIGVGLDVALLREHEPQRVTVEISDALGGLVAGALAFRLLLYERERRARLRQRIAVIADMNHHVRNALQVISFHAYTSADKEQVEAVKESMERIQWALKEVLPKL